MSDVFRKEKFELFLLTETKLKWNGEVSGCGVKSFSVDAQKIEIMMLFAVL